MYPPPFPTPCVHSKKILRMSNLLPLHSPVFEKLLEYGKAYSANIIFYLSTVTVLIVLMICMKPYFDNEIIRLLLLQYLCIELVPFLSIMAICITLGISCTFLYTYCLFSNNLAHPELLSQIAKFSEHTKRKTIYFLNESVYVINTRLSEGHKLLSISDIVQNCLSCLAINTHFLFCLFLVFDNTVCFAMGLLMKKKTQYITLLELTQNTLK